MSLWLTGARMRDETGGGSLSDGEAREIAKRLVDELRSPPGGPADELSAPGRELPPADEARVEQALVELGAVSPAATTVAEREGEGP